MWQKYNGLENYDANGGNRYTEGREDDDVDRSEYSTANAGRRSGQWDFVRGPRCSQNAQPNGGNVGTQESATTAERKVASVGHQSSRWRSDWERLTGR